MASGPGHIQLQRALDSIRVGRRHRTDLGDIDALAASMQEHGVVQIITIDPDGTLVCGLRRLAAMRKLGWKTADVWVRPGISSRLGALLAEQDDNVLHKPLTLTEQAALYRELKTLMAEDAARRQEASRFTAGGPNPRSDGGATVAPPSGTQTQGAGKTRAQAALMVTGRNSYTSMERIGELQRLAADESQPAAVRERAATELAGIDAGGSITAAHQRTRAERSLGELDQLAADSSIPADVRVRAAGDAAELRDAEARTRAAELERLAAEALARVRADNNAGKRRGTRPRRAATPAASAGMMTVRAFVLTWDELALWWERCDPTEIGPALTEEQWQRFEQTVAGTVAFAHTADAARRQARLHAV